MKRILVGIALVLFSSLVQAQTELFTPLIKDASKEKVLQEALTAQYHNDISNLNGTNKKYIAEIYKERYELIKEKFADNEIISDPKASAYCQSLAQQILKANPSLPSNSLRIVFSKAWWPNASSMGEGTILFNIGLFIRLHNESQAAFVLCHELAHYYLNHGNHAIERYVNTVYSDGFQKQLRSIQKSDYRQNQQVESLAKGITFKSRRHSREFEHAADSMAIELMKNTNYDLNEALSCLALLDSVDKDKYNYPLQLARRFDFAAYPFKKSWLKSEALLFAITKAEKPTAEDDSLKTHPDCKIRIQNLTAAVNALNKAGNKKFIQGEEQFHHLQEQFDFEILNYCFETNKVSKCLYYALEMTEAIPDNIYLHTIIGKCLNELYSRQKKHELGKIVDLPGPDHKEEYNNLLHLIQNLRLQEIAALSYYYLQQYSPAYANDPGFAAVLRTSKENFSN
jgi:hypothetical protein